MFGSAFKHTCVCARARVCVCVCIHVCMRSNTFPEIPFSQNERKRFVSSSTFAVSASACLGKPDKGYLFPLFFFSLPNPGIPREVFFEALAVGYTGRPQPGSKPRSEVVRQQLDYDHK